MYVDVKTTRYSNGHLLATIGKGDKEERPDAYVLMVGKFPSFYVAGIMSADELLREERLSEKFKGYAAEQKELKKPRG